MMPGMTGTPSCQVEISVSCTGLKDKDFVSKSDPVCILYVQDSTQSEHWLEYGRTETVKDCLDPSWEKRFVIDYRFEERQLLKFKVNDDDDGDDDDKLGKIEVSLGEVMAQQRKGFVRELKGGGRIHLRAEELSSNKEVVTLAWEAKKLDNKDTFGKSDPFLQVSSVNTDGSYSLVHRTEVIDNDLSPSWKPFTIEVRRLCNGDYSRALVFEIFDEDSGGAHDLIGTFQTSLQRLYRGVGSENIYEVISEKKKLKKGDKYSNSGIASLRTFKIEVRPSFLDFIQSGLQVNFTVAVDFTGSNGDPKESSSLHYRDPTGTPNQYVSAMVAVGEVIQDYDSDKMFPSLGFGAKVPPKGEVSHEFFLTLDSRNPFCAGLPGLISAYNGCLNSVELWGPTNFSPVIQHVAAFAKKHEADPFNYFVLLILTDGAITDLDETKLALVQASGLPMSVIIVGVGDADFESMEALDSDKARLTADGLEAKRDIVQFVEMNRFVREDGVRSKELLAKAVLAEVPGQVLHWMKLQGFQPGARGGGPDPRVWL